MNNPFDYYVVANIASRCWQLRTHPFVKGRAFLLRDAKEWDGWDPVVCPLRYGADEKIQRAFKEVPRFFSLPLIVETGSFWESHHIVHLLFDKKKNQAEYFDSRGRPLATHPSVLNVYKWLAPPGTTLIENERPFQCPADWFNCGAYVLYYLDQRIGKRIPMNEIQKPSAGRGIYHFRTQLALQLADSYALNAPPEEWELVDPKDVSAPTVSELT